MTLPVDYANATVSLDTHPDAHNATNAAVNALDGKVLPAGGAEDQILAKASSTDYDTEWVDSSAATLLDGTGVPSPSLGVLGDYYLDKTAQILYGPKADPGTEQKIAIAGAPNTDASFEAGVRVQFDIAGVVTGVRYQRVTGTTPTLTLRAWDDTTTAKLAEVDDTQTGGNGWFTASFLPPVPVTAGQIMRFSMGSTIGVPYRNDVQSVTSTTDCNFLAYCNGTVHTYPTTIASTFTFFVEPVFAMSGAWPVALGGYTTFVEQSSTPANPTDGTQIRTYCKANKVVYAFNNAGTMRYKSLDMASAGVTWVDHGSTPP